MYLSNLCAGNVGTYIFLGVIVVLFIVMTIFNSRQRKKQMAEEQKKKDSLCTGTKVITIGGIIGEVVSVNNEENSFVLKTGTCEITFDKRAIYQMTLPETATSNVSDAESKEEVKQEK